MEVPARGACCAETIDDVGDDQMGPKRCRPGGASSCGPFRAFGALKDAVTSATAQPGPQALAGHEGRRER